MDGVNLVTPEVAIAIRLSGVLIGAALVVLSTVNFLRHHGRDTFWDWTASVVVMTAFMSLTLSAYGGQLAMRGDEEAHRLLVSINLMLTSAAVGGTIALVGAWRPAKYK